MFFAKHRVSFCHNTGIWNSPKTRFITFVIDVAKVSLKGVILKVLFKVDESVIGKKGINDDVKREETKIRGTPLRKYIVFHLSFFP